MNEMIYTYDGSFEGFLCCIFDSYANKEVLTAITNDEDSAPILFPVRASKTEGGDARGGGFGVGSPGRGPVMGGRAQTA